MEISEAEYQELRNAFQMLGQIASCVEDFCEEDDTTLMGVLRVIAEYHHMRFNQAYEYLNRLQESNRKNS